MVHTVGYLIKKSRDIDLLTWTIDGTIGIDTDTIL